MKTLWLTSAVRTEDQVKHFMSQMKSYGLEVKGHFWEDNLEKTAWAAPREELLKPEISLWVILSPPEQMKVSSIRYGLSLLAMAVLARRGLSFPILILHEGKEAFPAESLPTPLQGADFLSLADPTLPAKLVAKVHAPPKEVLAEYRLDVYGNPQIGQWFEAGPAQANWPGAMFGVEEAEIDFHAVGPKGSLPSQTVLEFAQKGLKLSSGGKEYTAWAVQNEMNLELSYFVRVKGFPASILFGPYSRAEEADFYVVRLT